MVDEVLEIDATGGNADKLATAIARSLRTGVFVALVDAHDPNNVEVEVAYHGAPLGALMAVADLLLRNVVEGGKAKDCACDPCALTINNAQRALAALGVTRAERGTVN